MSNEWTAVNFPNGFKHYRIVYILYVYESMNKYEVIFSTSRMARDPTLPYWKGPSRYILSLQCWHIKSLFCYIEYLTILCWLYFRFAEFLARASILWSMSWPYAALHFISNITFKLNCFSLVRSRCILQNIWMDNIDCQVRSRIGYGGQYMNLSDGVWHRWWCQHLKSQKRRTTIKGTAFWSGMEGLEWWVWDKTERGEIMTNFFESSLQTSHNFSVRLLRELHSSCDSDGHQTKRMGDGVAKWIYVSLLWISFNFKNGQLHVTVCSSLSTKLLCLLWEQTMWVRMTTCSQGWIES